MACRSCSAMTSAAKFDSCTAKRWTPLPPAWPRRAATRSPAQAPAVEAYRADTGDGDDRLAHRGLQPWRLPRVRSSTPTDCVRARRWRLAALRDRGHVAAARDQLLADALADVATQHRHS